MMAGIHESGAGSRSSFEDSLAFLVLFSEELLDLVPDGIGVLDEQLRVRAANQAFLRAFDFDSLESARGVSLADDPLMRVPLPDWRDAPLREIVPELLARDESVSLNAVEVRHPASGELRTWSLKVVPWDTEDPRFRRLLLWVHPWTDRRPADSPPAPGETSPESPAEDVAPDADEPAPPSDDLAPDAPAPEEPSPEDASELFRLTNLTARLLETLPVGIAVLDGARRVKAASHRLETLFGRAFRRHGPGDRHLFAVFPELRDPAFDEWLARSPSDRFAHPAIPPGDPNVRFEVEVQSTGSVDDEGTETLLVFHEVEAMQPTPSAPEPTVGGPTPVGPAAILASDNLGRWPQAPADRLLIVEADSWTRMVLSDALREGGFEDLVFCENPAAVFDTQDPAAFAVILVGLDGDTSGLRALCERLVRDAARVPVLGIT
ncbi:MAG: PAS domain-containing protein, partial [Gemmatimonadetes bacterium]|nr:PAS domain-containing protein [Gemmatimonadota bacterium]